MHSKNFDFKNSFLDLGIFIETNILKITAIEVSPFIPLIYLGIKNNHNTTPIHSFLYVYDPINEKLLSKIE